jgi:hypothetical protein
VITVVTGLGRSGTTAMMRALHAGGMDPKCSNFDSYEWLAVNEVLHRDPARFAAECEGKAVKVLDPQLHPIPPCGDLALIWMRRNFREQAKSIRKFWRVLNGIQVSRREIPRVVKSLKSDTGSGLFAAARVGRVVEVRFEDLLMWPHTVCSDVVRHLGLPLDVPAMAAEIDTDRSTDCARVMREVTWMGRGAPA